MTCDLSVRRTIGYGESVFFYHYNAHGDVTLITDEAGNVKARFEYDSWGNPTEYGPADPDLAVAIGSWADSPGQGLFILFGGMLYDAAAGIYLTKTRAYNPKTGRFLQRDILDETGKDGVYKGFPFGTDLADSPDYSRTTHKDWYR